jgi:hypothetical protein
MPQPLRFLVADQSTIPEGRSADGFASFPTLDAALAHSGQCAAQPQHYLVEACWQNSTTRTQLYVRCPTYPDAVRRAQALVEEGRRDFQTGDVETWDRVTIRPCAGTPALRDLGWPSGQ